MRKRHLTASNIAENRERGVVIILVALLLPVFLGIVGLAIDVGILYAERQKMRTAADAAALAGAWQQSRGLSDSVEAAARNDAGLNGYAHGTQAVVVSVNRPPQSGRYVGDGHYVEVLVEKPVPTYFMKVFYSSPITVRVRSVAGPGEDTAEPYCLYALDAGWTRNAFDTVQGAEVSLPDCGIYVNSTFDKIQTGSFRAAPNVSIAAKEIQLAGSADINNNAIVTPNPIEFSQQITDPLAGLPNLALPIRDSSICTEPNRSYTDADNGITLQPGVYCGGITINESPTINFATGVYYLIGGGLQQNSNSTLIGIGVSFVVTGRDSPEFLQYGGINISGGGKQATRNTFFSAPTTGIAAGLLFYQDPSIVNYLKPSSFGGGGLSTLKLTGTLYFPSTEVDFSTVSLDPQNVGDYTILLGKTLSIQGNARINAIANPPWPLPGGPPRVLGSGHIALVEQ